jgi:hypothetical protein
VSKEIDVMKVINFEEKLKFYSSLDERRKRQFAGLEAISLGHGGIKLVGESFDISVVTVRRGRNEIITGDHLDLDRIRAKGGGRKKTLVRT